MPYKVVLDKLEELTNRLNSKDILSQDKELDYFVDFVLDCPLPMWLRNVAGETVFVNPAYTKVFGVKLEDYVNRKDDDVWKGGEDKEYRANDNLILTTGRGRFFCGTSWFRQDECSQSYTRLQVASL